MNAAILILASFATVIAVTMLVQVAASEIAQMRRWME